MHSVALYYYYYYYVVVVIIFCRRIVLHPSAFDSRVKFLEKTRRSFGGGAFNVSVGGLLERYLSSLKEDYYRGVVRWYHAAECVGQQTLGKGHWCFSSEVMHQPI